MNCPDPPDSHSRSARLSERAWRVLPNGNSRSTINRRPHAIYVAEAEGAELVDVDGNRYLDFSNNMTSLIHGNAYAPVVDAVARQIARGSGFSMATEVEIELAELLYGRIASFERVRFCNSGSEAVMNLVKASRAFTGRPKIAKVEGFYHGSYDFAEVGLANGPNDRRDGAPVAKPVYHGTPQSVLDDVVLLPFNDTATMQHVVERHASELACVLIDPLPLALGMATFETDYLDALAQLTRQHGILLCLDEVVSLRLDYRGAQGELGLEPDLTAIGKIIGGGFPVGAVAGRSAVMAVFEETETASAQLPHGGTFNANPVTMNLPNRSFPSIASQQRANIDARPEGVQVGRALDVRYGLLAERLRCAGQGGGHFPQRVFCRLAVPVQLARRHQGHPRPPRLVRHPFDGAGRRGARLAVPPLPVVHLRPVNVGDPQVQLQPPLRGVQIRQGACVIGQAHPRQRPRGQRRRVAQQHVFVHRLEHRGCPLVRPLFAQPIRLGDPRPVYSRHRIHRLPVHGPRKPPKRRNPVVHSVLPVQVASYIITVIDAQAVVGSSANPAATKAHIAFLALRSIIFPPYAAARQRSEHSSRLHVCGRRFRHKAWPRPLPKSSRKRRLLGHREPRERFPLVAA